jgi:hypothetical protein
MRYREVMRMPLWLLAIIYFFMLSIVISLWAALGDLPALASLAVLTFALIWIYFSTALTIEIDDSELRVGKAHIPLHYIGECIDLNKNAIGRARTRDADPNAFLAIRFWVSTGVLVKVSDSRDATPYWLVSSKKGAKLIQALQR